MTSVVLEQVSPVEVCWCQWLGMQTEQETTFQTGDSYLQSHRGEGQFSFLGTTVIEDLCYRTWF